MVGEGIPVTAPHDLVVDIALLVNEDVSHPDDPVEVAYAGSRVHIVSTESV